MCEKQTFANLENELKTIGGSQTRGHDFFEGRKISKSGQQYFKHTICLKNVPKHTIFSQKVEKHTILAIQGEQDPPLALPCADAHVTDPFRD